MLFRPQFLPAFLAAACSLACASRAERLPEGIAATVDSRPIPRRLVDAFLRNGREALSLDPASDAGRESLAKLRAAILDELVERALIAAEAGRRGVEPTAEQIDVAERRMVDFTGGETRFARFLADNGFTRAEYRDAVLAAALRGEAVTAALTRDVAVSDDEVKMWFEAHRADPEFQLPERVTGAHILVNGQLGVLTSQLEIDRPGLRRGTPEMPAALTAEVKRRRELAEGIRAQAMRPGADFAALAARFSEDNGTKSAGGSLGTFPQGTHAKALDDAFFALAAGETGPVVETEFGFHIIRTLDRRPAAPRTLAEATPLIHAALLRTKRAAALRDWLKKARATAKVEVAP